MGELALLATLKSFVDTECELLKLTAIVCYDNKHLGSDLLALLLEPADVLDIESVNNVPLLELNRVNQGEASTDDFHAKHEVHVILLAVG